MQEFNKVMAPVRPFISLAGSLIIAAGILKYFGINVPISGSGLELAVAGYLMKSI